MKAYLLLAAAFWLLSCRSEKQESARTRVLETGAALLQSKAPLNDFHTYVNGFHFQSGNMNRQMEAHHFCSVVNEDFNQCVIFDGNAKDSHLIGIEYIVSERIFKNLPSEEKKLWHSHVYEVKSGELTGPGLPEAAEHEFMKKFISTYGKTWHTWMDHHSEVPLGTPALMMGFTSDGQVQPSLVAARDQRLGVSTEENRRKRNDIPDPPIVAGADSWEHGPAPQLHLK